MGFWVSANGEELAVFMPQSPVSSQGRIGFDSEQVSGLQQDHER